MSLDKKLHIVIVTVWYSPRIGVAVNRMQAFAQYLHFAGMKISVIALQDSSDIPAMEDLNGITVIRVPNKVVLKRAKFYPGEPKFKHLLKAGWNLFSARINPLQESGWMNEAIRELGILHENNEIDLIISSFSPSEAHLAALSFLDRHPNVKWIADMRDEMSMNKLLPTIIQKNLARYEKQISRRADAVTSVSKPILDQFRELMPNVRHFLEVRNGYNHDLTFETKFNEKFTIVYAGSFYGLIKPDNFFLGLKAALIQQKFEFEIVFVGTHHNFQIPQEFSSNCRFVPKVSQLKSIEFMANADANLLILPKDQRKGVYSGKLFDYLSVKKPIIAIVDPADVAAQLITELNAGFIADFSQTDEISNAILSAYALWKNKSSLEQNDHEIELLHRKHQVKKLELLIRKIIVS